MAAWLLAGSPESCDRSFAVTASLERPDTKSLVQHGQRSYELAKTPQEALDLLRTPSNPPILSPEQAIPVTGSEPFVALSDMGFTIYKPWRFRGTSPEGVRGEDIAVGPAVAGRLVATPRGSRLDVRVVKYAPTPGQRFSLGLFTSILATLLIFILVVAGAHPVALGLVALMGGGSVGSVLFYRHRRRSQDIGDLLAIVERTFGPRELPSGDDAPHRRDEGPVDSDP